MARRLNLTHEEANYKFYVYKIDDENDCLYIGKGTNRRHIVSSRRFNNEAVIIAYFRKESYAYDFEREMIAEHKPIMNKCLGGNGPYTKKRRARRREKWEMEIERLGSRRYVAKLLLKYEYFLPFHGISASKIEEIRGVANGFGI